MRTARLAALFLVISCEAGVAPHTSRADDPRSRERTIPEETAKPQVPLPKPPAVLVALTRTAAAGHGRVRVKGAWTLFDAAGTALRAGTSLDAELAFAGASASLGGGSFPVDGELRPAADGDLRIDTAAGGATESRVYPGTLRVDRGPDGRLRPVVALGVEEYVAAVVNSEIPATFPREAQRVQAVIARSYALASTHRTSPEAPLVMTDVGGIDQEFTGLAALAEHRRVALDAAESTRGMVLTEDGASFVAYYHSTCGGATCPGSVVFGAPGEARALSGGVVCPWCESSKYFRWDAKIAGASVAKAAGLSGTLDSFVVAERTAGGRAAAFDVKAGGKTKRVRAAEFRLRVGPSALRSVLLDLAIVDGGDLVVKGRGWGHGVGLCQMGAKSLAEKGLTAEAILAMYYPGAALEPRW